MERADEAIVLMYDAEEFLRKYPVWKNQMKTLNTLIEHADGLCDNALIEQYSLRRRPLDGLPVTKGFTHSRTESLALRLNELRNMHRAEQEAAIKMWMKELRALQMQIALYNVAIETLTDQERRLVRLHFHKGYSLRRLAAGDVPPSYRMPISLSLYSLRQMKQSILSKVTMILVS